jgi:F-box interacting protein
MIPDAHVLLKIVKKYLLGHLSKPIAATSTASRANAALSAAPRRREEVCEYPEQLFEVFTLDSDSNARWRVVKVAPYNVFLFWRTLVINGIVYFFSDDIFQKEDHLGSFDLETEEWIPGLTGPLRMLLLVLLRIELSLATMNGCLVVVLCNSSNIDLWSLMDFERGLWIKQHNIQVELGVQQHDVHSVGVMPQVFLISIINAKDRVKHVGSSRTMVNLGHHLENPVNNH